MGTGNIFDYWAVYEMNTYDYCNHPEGLSATTTYTTPMPYWIICPENLSIIYPKQPQGITYE